MRLFAASTVTFMVAWEPQSAKTPRLLEVLCSYLALTKYHLISVYMARRNRVLNVGLLVVHVSIDMDGTWLSPLSRVRYVGFSRHSDMSLTGAVAGCTHKSLVGAD